MYSDYDEDEAMRLRAEDRQERRRLRTHWCRDCLGFDGLGSPCYVEPEEDEEGETEENDDE